MLFWIHLAPQVALIDLSKRSNAPEIIDAPNLSRSEWDVILRELRLANRWLGGSRAVVKELKSLVQELSQEEQGTREIRIVDFGSGSADIPMALVAWARRKGYSIQVLAVDIDSSVCKIAQYHTRYFPEIVILQGDVQRSFLKEGSCDLILCSAFLHHFGNEKIMRLLEDFRLRARKGIVISDLHRHLLAYVGIRLLTALLSRSKAIRHDGPLSVLKGFRREEIQSIVGGTGIEGTRLKWRWAFRYVIFIPAAPPCHSILGPASAWLHQ
ncbi:methyltransferase domain-containing protein [Acidobacteria bacterium AH-259-D05]|nr:methyltransferase domain-containing protein [Acidobacteria bacterium AH-259-D05]